MEPSMKGLGLTLWVNDRQHNTWLDGTHVALCCSKNAQSVASLGDIAIVVFLGDEVQLPSVCDLPVYNNHLENPAAKRGVLVWSEFTTGVTLENMLMPPISHKP